jgi:hypothetical protein
VSEQSENVIPWLRHLVRDAAQVETLLEPSDTAVVPLAVRRAVVRVRELPQRVRLARDSPGEVALDRARVPVDSKATDGVATSAFGQLMRLRLPCVLNAGPAVSSSTQAAKDKSHKNPGAAEAYHDESNDRQASALCATGDIIGCDCVTVGKDETPSACA